MRARSRSSRLAAVLAVCGGVFAGVGLLPAHADSDAHRDISAVRAATAQYHNEAKAIADGYERVDFCVESPAGAMGYHYLNPELFGAPLDVRRPAALIYQPGPDGKRRLVAVEYFKVDDDQNLGTSHDRPTQFGVAFDGPMPGHEPGMPVHYDQHVWVWQHNPAGMFAPWNPAGTC